MLGFLFGFNARLGRLPYFLASLGLGVVMIVIFMAMIWAGVHANPGRIEQMMATIGWPLALMVIFFIWANFMLQAMRLRDIGWDPVCVIPLWIAIMIVDGVVATKMPEWSLTSAHKAPSSAPSSILAWEWPCCSFQAATRPVTIAAVVRTMHPARAAAHRSRLPRRAWPG
jgi:uncharacterized membrane protein YhaH (DUF805 family)